MANAHSDSVSLIDATTLSTTTVAIPTLPDGLLGTTPTSLVFSADGKHLYVAAALNNAVAVLEQRGAIAMLERQGRPARLVSHSDWSRSPPGSSGAECEGQRQH